MTEYRINKKGAECFRTRIAEEARKKLAELQEKRPGCYTMQCRFVPVTKYGVALTDLTGKPLWSAWR